MTDQLKKIVIALLSLLFAMTSARGQAPIYQAQPAGEFFTRWLLCGPFPNPPDASGQAHTEFLPGFYHDYLQAHGGETGLQVAADQIEKFAEGECRWRPFESSKEFVDLQAAISKEWNVLAYTYCQVMSELGGRYTLALGSDDGIRAWVNGQEVINNWEAGSMLVDEDEVAVILKPGVNTILLKIEQGAGEWKFCCRLKEFHFEDYYNKSYFMLTRDKDSHPLLRYRDSLYGELFKQVKLSVFEVSNPDSALWQQPWERKLRTPIPISNKEYGEYRLQVKLEFVDGHTRELVFPFKVGKRPEYVLFENGKTRYHIVVGNNAAESEIWAANELAHWLKEISSTDFMVVRDTGPLAEQEIIIGFNTHTKLILGDKVQTPANDDERFFIQNHGPKILIYGGRQRGTMYGVMTFLEREFGCRWYTPDVSMIPKREHYAFSSLNYSAAPAIKIRYVHSSEGFDPLWNARNKLNGDFFPQPQPGDLITYWGIHTFGHLIPPAEFFDKHSEYFSMVNGKRIKEKTQLCLTNKNVLRLVIERLKKVMRENPEHLIYDVSQNDWQNPCECPNCQKIVEQEGSQSGVLLWFVNQVAEAVEHEFPDKFVGTLAYEYTRRPPKIIRPRENVVIRFCTYESNQMLPLTHAEDSNNVQILEDLRGWAKIASHIFIWTYVVNFDHYISPHPNFKTLQPNMQLFREVRVMGVMTQGADAFGSEFSGLRSYVLAKLLWNPDDDVRGLIEDFIFGYYGRSSNDVLRYFDLLHGLINAKTDIGVGTSPARLGATNEFIINADRLFDQAEVIADDPQILRRVQLARLPLLYLKLTLNLQDAAGNGDLERFIRIAKQQNVQRVNPNFFIDRQIEAWRNYLKGGSL